MQKNLDELIDGCRNFGYLAAYEPLLAYDGASAQSYVYSDPDLAMERARRFSSAMTRKAAAVLGVDLGRGSLLDGIHQLYGAAAVARWARDTFREVSEAGERVGASRIARMCAALNAVRGCFDLGLWLHNTITGGQAVRAFIAPLPPDSLLPTAAALDGTAMRELRLSLDVHETRLAAVIIEHGAGVPVWTHTGAIALAIGWMAAQKATGDALRGMEPQFQQRICALAAGLDERLADDEAELRPRRAQLSQNALRACLVGYAERQRLIEITNDLDARTGALERRWLETQCVAVSDNGYPGSKN